VGAAVPSGDLMCSYETTNRRSESSSHIFIEPGAATRQEEFLWNPREEDTSIMRAVRKARSKFSLEERG
jgi:hypothetical protein